MERLGDCMYRQICKYEQECEPNCRRYVDTKYLLKLSHIPQSKQGLNTLNPSVQDVPAFEQLADIRNNIQDFVEEGRKLYLWSNQTGNGKTTWAIKLGLQYINQVWKYFYETPACLFISVSDFLYKSKAFDNPILTKEAQDIRRSAEKSDLIILDDVGLDYISKYDYTSLFSLVDVLCLNDKPLIVTSNFSPQELNELVGDRLPSRLCSDIVIELKGMDRRGE